MVKFWQRAGREVPLQTSPTSVAHPMPIVVGAPRSGTTLLRFMLDAHPELAIPPETGFLKLTQHLKGKDDQLRAKFFHDVVNYSYPLRSWPDFEIPEETFWTALNEITPFTIADGYRTFYQLYASRREKPRWGDKTPTYCHYLNTIRRILPESRFIHIVRDGRDAALSLRKMWFSPGWEIETQASYWRDCVSAARRDGDGHPDYLEVRYEDLILNTRETLERICAHVSLTFDDVMLNYYEHARERLKEHKGRSLPNGITFLTKEERFQQQVLTTKPPDASRVFAWKQSMEAYERRRFSIVAGKLLEELGYET